MHPDEGFQAWLCAIIILCLMSLPFIPWQGLGRLLNRLG